MTDKEIERYKKQTGKSNDNIYFQFENDFIDNLINSHLQVREQFEKYKKQEAEKQQTKKIQEQVKQWIKETFNNLFE